MKDASRVILLGLIITIFLVIGGVLIYYAANINEIIEGTLYNIGITLNAKDLNGNKIDPLYLNSFLFYYDFSSKKGNISFMVPEDLSFENIRLELPDLVDNKSIKIYVLRDGSTIYNLTSGKDYTNYPTGEYSSFFNNNYSYLSIESSFIFKEHDRLVIKFEFTPEIIPKGRFYFRNYRGGGVVIREGDGGIGNLNLILGKKYECIAPCLYNFKGITEMDKSFEGNLKMKLDGSEIDHLFSINAFSRTKKFYKNLFASAGISLFTSGLVLLITVFLINKPEKTLQKIRKAVRQSIVNLIRSDMLSTSEPYFPKIL